MSGSADVGGVGLTGRQLDRTVSEGATVLRRRAPAARRRGPGIGPAQRIVPEVDHVFETFPFPENWETHSDLEVAGAAYHGLRADLMLGSDEGLTTTYNRFHDSEEQSSGITRLRELHAAMDRAVLAAYGWTDIGTACEFFP